MFVVIMGCGRVGARLALLLTQAGHHVTVIDQLRSAFGRLGPDFAGTTLLGDAVDQDVLAQADIQRADVFVAATQGDNRNIMASQMAQHIFNVPTVITRIYDPLRAETFATLGLRTVSPTIVGADRIFAEVTGKPAQTLKEVGQPPAAVDAKRDQHESDSHYALIAGGGNVGFYLARELIAKGNEVLIIESSVERAEFLSTHLGNFVVRGHADEAITLAEAGAWRAGAVIAVTGDDDDNLVICQLAKHRFGARRTIARINNPHNEQLFRLLGVDATINATEVLLSVLDSAVPSLSAVSGSQAQPQRVVSHLHRQLHEMIDELPEGQLAAVQPYLEYLCGRQPTETGPGATPPE